MRYRDIITEGRDQYLFHGTDLVSALGIIKTNMIDGSQQYDHNPMGVSLSRDYTMAREFGTMWDRQFPVVFVIDQNKLVMSKLKLFPRRDSFSPGEHIDREAEEFVSGSIPELSKYLVSINCDIRHINAAIGDSGYIDWVIEDEKSHADFFDSQTKDYLSSEEVLKKAIRALAAHPLFNAWVPRVQWRKGSEQIPTG